MGLFRKKCLYCGQKIEKGKEVLGEVKIPEFTVKVKRYFCSEHHLNLYKLYVKGTPSKNSCPYCVD